MAMMRTTAHSQKRFPNRHRYRRPLRLSAQLTDGRRLTRLLMITQSTPMMNPGEFTFCHQFLTHRCHPEWLKEN